MTHQRNASLLHDSPPNAHCKTNPYRTRRRTAISDRVCALISPYVKLKRDHETRRWSRYTPRPPSCCHFRCLVPRWQTPLLRCHGNKAMPPPTANRIETERNMADTARSEAVKGQNISCVSRHKKLDNCYFIRKCYHTYSQYQFSIYVFVIVICYISNAVHFTLHHLN